jgi:uncharacterized membrane protein YfcA
VTLSFLAVVAAGAAAGGFIQGLSGFAFGLVALAIWAWWIDPAVAGALVVFGSLLGQVLSLGTVRHRLQPSLLIPFIVGGAIGVPLGVVLLRYIDPIGFKLVVGVILLVWCPAMLLPRSLPRVTGGGRWADGAAGWVGGVMGGLGGLTGPAPTLWCVLRGWGRDTQRAVFQTFNLAMQALTMTVYVATGTIGRDTALLFGIVAPAMLVPTLIGAKLYRRFSDAGFQLLILALLTASGALLVASSLAQML